MSPLLPPLLADINIAAQVVAFLRHEGIDVISALEMGWANLDDRELLDQGRALQRYVLTHDADFGRLAIHQGHPFHGVIHLRPGDDPPAVVIEHLRPLLRFACDWTPPLLAVYQGARLRLRRP